MQLRREAEERPVDLAPDCTGGMMRRVSRSNVAAPSWRLVPDRFRVGCLRQPGILQPQRAGQFGPQW